MLCSFYGGKEYQQQQHTQPRLQQSATLLVLFYYSTAIALAMEEFNS